MRKYVISEYHKSGHLGVPKLLDIIKSQFYWPGMRIHLTNHVSPCNIGMQSMQGWCYPESSAHPLSTPLLIPIHQAESPMEFIALDIAYMPVDTEGFQYILLIGDIFSKYIEAVPMYKQIATDIINVIWKHWLCRYGYPKFMPTDRGSNVDGQVINVICNKFGMEKRRTSGYHSEGNGFAERNIRSIREILRISLLEFKLPQFLWRDLLPSVVVALNTGESTATKCSPFSVVYGRTPVLSLDILMDTIPDAISAPTPKYCAGLACAYDTYSR